MRLHVLLINKNDKKKMRSPYFALTLLFVAIFGSSSIISTIPTVQAIDAVNDDEQKQMADAIMSELEKEMQDELLTLKQVHVITRHGSRYPLVKRSDNLTELTAGTLTANGERQMYELGRWLKDRYNKPLKGQFDKYEHNQVRFESSDFDRTIVSAMMLAAGLYDAKSRDPFDDNMLQGSTTGTGIPLLPMRQNIPVYTMQGVHDIYLRAYDKCPRYIDDLNELYDSTEWKQMENDNADLLRQLASIPLFAQYKNVTTGLIPLQELYNIYDLVNVAFTECDSELEPDDYDKSSEYYNRTTRACQELGYQIDDFITLFNDDFDFDYAFTNLTHEVELVKYGTDIAGKLLGGNLMGRIVERMFEEGPTTFYAYSAHYPTILGIFAAMDDLIELDLEVIPTYSSALIFELYEMRDTEHSNVVKMIYRDGDYGKNAVYERLPWGKICTGDSCDIESLLEFVVNNINIDSWCYVCNNTDADICLQQKVDYCAVQLEEQGGGAVSYPPNLNKYDFSENTWTPTDGEDYTIDGFDDSSANNSKVIGHFEDTSANGSNGTWGIDNVDDNADNNKENGAAGSGAVESTEPAAPDYKDERELFGLGIFIGICIAYIPVAMWYVFQRRRKRKYLDNLRAAQMQKLHNLQQKKDQQQRKRKSASSPRSAQEWPSRDDIGSVGEPSFDDVSIVDLNDDVQSTTADDTFAGSYLI